MSPLNCLFSVSVVVSSNLLFSGFVALISLCSSFLGPLVGLGQHMYLFELLLAGSYLVFEFLARCQFALGGAYALFSFNCSEISCSAGAIFSMTFDITRNVNCYLE
jgi:hypothetical protein